VERVASGVGDRSPLRWGVQPLGPPGGVRHRDRRDLRRRC